MPKPVRELLRLVHVEQIDLSEVKRVDFEIISYLKQTHPDLYRSLRRAVKSMQRPGSSGVAIEDDVLLAAALGEPTNPSIPGDGLTKSAHPE